MTNQEGVHAAVRNVTATTGTYLEDWHALFTANSVAAGPFNERMLSFLNTNLGTSYARLTDAMNAFAISQGFAGWTDMNTFTLSEAAALLAAETQGLALVFTDDAFFARDGFYGSAEIKDTGTPANNYSAAPTKAASSLLTHSAPSAKLSLGPDGTFRYQAHNLRLQSSALATSWASLAAGSGLASTATNDYALGPDGETYASRLQLSLDGGTTTSDISGCQQNVALLSGATYMHSVWLRSTDGSSSYVMQVQGADGTGSNITVTGTWTKFEIEGVSGGTAPLSLRLRGGQTPTNSNTADVLVWGDHVRRTPSDPTYLATTSAARYALPLEWDESGALNGLLVEEARTNICLHNRNLLGSGWSNLSVTAAKDATGIDGVANSASSLTSSSTAGYFYRVMNSLSPNTLYTLSAYVRRKTGSGAVYFTPDFLYSTGVLGTESVTGPNLSTNGDFATNDLTGWTSTVTGTGTNDASSGACSMAAGTGTAAINQTIAGTRGKLYRATFDIVAISGSLTAGRSSNSPAFTTTGTKQIIIYALETGNISLIFRLATATHTATVDNIVVQEIVGESLEIAVTGNYQRFTRTFKTVDNGGVQSLAPAFSFATSGDAVEVDYIQVEAGGFVTSPIETFASTVTRAADNISLATSAFPLGTTELTLYLLAQVSQTASPIIAELANTTRYNASTNIELDTSPRVDVTGAAFVSQASIGLGAAVVGTYHKVAVSTKDNDFRAAMDGVLGTPDTSGTARASTLDFLTIGTRLGAGGQHANASIRQVMVLPRTLSNAELQALTGA